MKASFSDRGFRTAIAFLFLMISQGIIAQEALFYGKVLDAVSGEPLPGVNILVDSTGGGTSLDDGSFNLPLTSGSHRFTFSFIGYKPEVFTISFSHGESVSRVIRLQSRSFELHTAVISASRYEQRLSDVTVSMEILKAESLENQHTLQLDEALRLIPGVDVIDGQANIRGGSGFSYGAGSRVMVLVDGLPMITGDVSEVKWNYLPVENIGQIEIIKGASSALYGSSALNGVINIRTAKAGIQPLTRAEMTGGIYMRPSRRELSWWWDRNLLYGGFQFSHLRKAGSFDINLGANAFWDEGYRKDNYQRFARISAGMRFSPRNNNKLSMGLQSTVHFQRTSDFLIWMDADSGAFVQNPSSIAPTDGIRMNLDPFISYYDRRQGNHHLKTRYYKVRNTFEDDPDKENGSDLYYGEYQFSREFDPGWHLTAGLAGSYAEGRSALYGDHSGSSTALFVQLDRKFFDRLSTSLGLRWERYSLDSEKDSRPVLRAGLNYQPARYTFLRTSFGQGYRYPSMAEKYTSTSLGNLKIFPNPDLEPETGWSAEMGIRQGMTGGDWQVYFDLAAFWMEYDQMMEFTFGVYKPDSVQIPTTEHLGFKSLNVGAARIRGIDLSVSMDGRIRKSNLRVVTGYTYMDPMEIGKDTSSLILKYRYRHSVKQDIQFSVGRLEAGLTMTYNSFMERIDKEFETDLFFPGLKEYRMENDKGAVVFDLRISWKVGPSSRISIMAKNLFNKEYMGRPGDIQPPCQLSVQYLLKI